MEQTTSHYSETVFGSSTSTVTETQIASSGMELRATSRGWVMLLKTNRHDTSSIIKDVEVLPAPERREHSIIYSLVNLLI
jgi:hypothetical protein